MTSAQGRSDWLTVEAAARRLGVSPATIKRRIQDGKPVRLAGNRTVILETELIERPQGHEWRVRVIGALPAISSAQHQPDSEDESPSRSVLSGAQDRSEGYAALRAIIEEERQERRDLAAENADLRERVGRAEAERDSLAAQLDAERRARAEAVLRAGEPGRRWWWPW